WSAFSLPTTFSVVATSLSAQQYTMGIGIQSMVRRIPMMLGPLVGGFLITRLGWQTGVQCALLICLALTVITIAFQWLMIEPGPAASSSTNIARTGGFITVVKSFTPALRELLVSDILIRFCERIPYAFVILWAMNFAQVSAQQYGFLVAFEMLTAMVCY